MLTSVVWSSLFGFLDPWRWDWWVVPKCQKGINHSTLCKISEEQRSHMVWFGSSWFGMGSSSVLHIQVNMVYWHPQFADVQWVIILY